MKFFRKYLVVRLLCYLALLAVILLADRSSDEEIRFSVFYIVVVATASWWDTFWVGYGLSGLVAIITYSFQSQSSYGQLHPSVPYWNTFVSLSSFLLVSTIASFLSKSNASKKAAIEAREHILGFVSHDLNNILYVVQASARMLKQKFSERSTDEAAGDVDLLYQSSTRMKRIVDDLLLFTVMDKGLLKIETKPCNLSEVIRKVGREQEIALAHKRVRLTLLGLEGEPVWISCDEGRLFQVMDNILRNAIRFSRMDGAVVINVTQGAEGIRVSVKDEGRGISAEDLPHIFEPFRQGKTEHNSGAGLGLFISQRIMELHGGKLWAESPPAGGSIFHVEFPPTPEIAAA